LKGQKNEAIANHVFYSNTGNGLRKGNCYKVLFV